MRGTHQSEGRCGELAASFNPYLTTSYPHGVKNVSTIQGTQSSHGPFFCGHLSLRGICCLGGPHLVPASKQLGFACQRKISARSHQHRLPACTTVKRQGTNKHASLDPRRKRKHNRQYEPASLGVQLFLMSSGTDTLAMQIRLECRAYSGQVPHAERESIHTLMSCRRVKGSSHRSRTLSRWTWYSKRFQTSENEEYTFSDEEVKTRIWPGSAKKGKCERSRTRTTSYAGSKSGWLSVSAHTTLQI